MVQWSRTESAFSYKSHSNPRPSDSAKILNAGVEHNKGIMTSRKNARSERVKQTGSRRLLLSVGCILLVRTFEIFDTSAVEMPDPRRHFLDEVMIVRH